MEPELTLQQVKDTLGDNPTPDAYSACVKEAHAIAAALKDAVRYNPDAVGEILGIEINKRPDGSLSGYDLYRGWPMRDPGLALPIRKNLDRQLEQCSR